MATKKRAGLGRGLSALIPTNTPEDERAVDVFFDGSAPSGRTQAAAKTQPNTTTESEPKKTATAKRAPAKKAAPKTEPKARATTPSAKHTKTAERSQGPESANREENVENIKTSDDAASETPQQPEDAELLPVPGASLRVLDPSTIVPNLWQPRHEFDQDALDELIISVREFGVLQPIVVRPIRSDDPRAGEAEYELIMGERRLRATKAAGRTEIPAIIRETEDEDMLRDALLENLHRADLNPLEEASAYRQLLDDFGCTQDELAERIGRSRPVISNTLRLLRLPVEVQQRVAAGVLSAGHARAILSMGEPAAMQQLADKIVNENLSVRDAEQAAARGSMRASTHTNTPKPEFENDSVTGYLNEVGERLGDRLNTRVKVTLRKTKGQITIDYASLADLRRILAELGEDSEQ